jgi:capsular polysaccharide export protein
MIKSYNIYTTSKQLIKNTKNFLNLKHYSILDSLFSRSGVFYGWGRKRSGLKAVNLAKRYNNSFVLLEDNEKGSVRDLLTLKK